MPLDLDQIRRLVRQQRRKRGLSQSLASGLIGHSQKWLSDFENGRVDPPASMVFRIAALLGIRLVAEIDADSAVASPVPADDDGDIDLGRDL